MALWKEANKKNKKVTMKKYYRSFKIFGTNDYFFLYQLVWNLSEQKEVTHFLDKFCPDEIRISNYINWKHDEKLEDIFKI